ncbi:hypothetical protein NL676_020989 [Syzygium grande]|nr:hypothetical protein NL676_020989 [Syzygium grande]
MMMTGMVWRQLRRWRDGGGESSDRTTRMGKGKKVGLGDGEEVPSSPAIVNPSQTTSTESRDSEPAKRSNATRPSQEPKERSQNCGNLLKQAAPAMAGLLSHVSATNSASKDEEQHLTQPRPQRTLCKKEFKPDKDVYMYNDRPYCSSDCRDDRIALDGFRRKDFGLGKEDQKTMKSLREDLNKLQMNL